MKLIKVKNLIHNYIRYDDNGDETDSFAALTDVTLDVEKGSFIAVLGSNGSGKSTLAKHLNALLQPSSGTVWIDGKDTAHEEELLAIRKQAGMVFQNPDNQIVANVVEEDVAFGPENIGLPSTEIQRRVEECLEKVGMTAYRYHSPNKLSGGQKQRIAIAGVLAMRPDCIILDEPTAMLDPHGRMEVIEAIQELNRREGITVILITHYMEETVAADRIIVVDEGHIVMDGTPKQIFAQTEELKKHRLTLPQVTELASALQREGIPMPDAVLTEEEFLQEFERIMKSSFGS